MAEPWPDTRVFYVETPPELAGAAFEARVRTKAAELKQELIRQTLEDAGSWKKALEFEYRREYPVRFFIPGLTLPSPEEISRYEDRVRTEYYEWVEPAFESHLSADPDAFNPMIHALRTIESMFGGSQDHAGNFFPASRALVRVNDVRVEMGHWQGQLQANFLDNFLGPLQTVSLNQAALARLVREQLEVCKVLYIRHRHSLLDLLDKAINSVKSLKGGCVPKTYLWSSLFMIAAGTAITPVAPASANVLVITGTLAQGLTPETEETTEISAPTAQEVALKVAEALGKLNADLFEGEDKAKDAFANISSMIADERAKAANGGRSDLAVATPSLSTAPAAEIIGELRPRFLRPRD